MNELKSYFNKDIKAEVAQFMRSYHTALHVFDTFDKENNKNPYSTLSEDNNHLMTILNSRGEMSCVFIHKIHQGNYLFDYGVDPKNVALTIFHHNDMDGYSSAAIVYKIHNNEEDGYIDTEFIEYNYGNIYDPIKKIKKFNTEYEKRYKVAVIVDLSLPLYDDGRESLLDSVVQNYDKIIWIDHHGTSLNVALEAFKRPILYQKMSIFIDTRMSSAMQSYCLSTRYDPNSNNEEFSMVPQIISYYDRKDDRRFPVFFNLGLWMNQYIFDFNMNDPTHQFWIEIFNEDKLIDVLKTGETLCSIRLLRDKTLYEADAKYVCEGYGLTVIAINGNGNSNRFTDPITNPNTIKVLFRKVDKDKYTFSAYSDSIEVKKMNLGKVLRETLGGGGHPGAAGVTVDKSDIWKYYKTVHTNQAEGRSITLNQKSARYSISMANIISVFSKILIVEWNKFKEQSIG